MTVKYKIKNIEDHGTSCTVYASFSENGEEVCQLEFEVDPDASIKAIKSDIVNAVIEEFEDFSSYKPENFVFEP